MNAQTSHASNVLDIAARRVEPSEHRPDLLKEVRALALPDGSALAALQASTQTTLALFKAIECDDDMELVTMECQAIKGQWQKVDEERKRFTGPLNAAIKAINAWYEPALTALAHGEAQLKRLMADWTVHQQQLLLEARRQAAEREAAERERIAAEQQRIEDERAAAAAAGDTAAAERAHIEAQALVLSAQVMTPAVLVPEQHRPAGVSARTQLVVEVTELLALVRHVAQHPELIGLLKADDTKLKAYCRGLGEHANLPGVTVRSKPVIAVSAR